MEKPTTGTKDKKAKKRRPLYWFATNTGQKRPRTFRKRTILAGIPALRKRGVNFSPQNPKNRSFLASRLPSAAVLAKTRRTGAGYRPYTNPYTKTGSVLRTYYRYSANQKLRTLPADVTTYQYTYSRSKTGNYLRNWRQLIRQGANATTKFNGWTQLRDYKPPRILVENEWRVNSFNPWQLVRSEDNGLSFMHTELGPIATHYIPGVAQKAQDRAAVYLIREINRAHHQLQGGVILGQIDKTARLLTDTAKNLKQGVFAYISKAVGIRQGRGSKRSKQKAIANSYLEATFGWQPLLLDCKDFAKTLGRLIHESDKVRFRAGAEWEEQYSQVVSQHNFAGLVLNVVKTKKTKAAVVYRGFLRGLPYEVGSPPLEKIISMSGFDLRSFVPTMWELIPYSFVVDYFTNIGDCLQSWTVDTSIVKTLWRTEVVESTSEVKLVYDLDLSISNIKALNGTNGKNYTGSKQDGSSTSTYRTVARDVAGVPLLVPQLTGLDLPWRQFANIGALIRAKMR